MELSGWNPPSGTVRDAIHGEMCCGITLQAAVKSCQQEGSTENLLLTVH